MPHGMVDAADPDAIDACADAATAVNVCSVSQYARWIGTSAGTIHWDQRRQLYAPDFFSAFDRADDDSWLAAAFRDAEGLDPVGVMRKY